MSMRHEYVFRDPKQFSQPHPCLSTRIGHVRFASMTMAIAVKGRAEVERQVGLTYQCGPVDCSHARWTTSSQHAVVVEPLAIHPMLRPV
jgi:hypothetical protein